VCDQVCPSQRRTFPPFFPSAADKGGLCASPKMRLSPHPPPHLCGARVVMYPPQRCIFFHTPHLQMHLSPTPPSAADKGGYAPSKECAFSFPSLPLPSTPSVAGGHRALRDTSRETGLATPPCLFLEFSWKSAPGHGPSGLFPSHLCSRGAGGRERE
jgi:hypothetical protein